jgi:Amt family ammonium transporter
MKTKITNLLLMAFVLFVSLSVCVSAQPDVTVLDLKQLIDFVWIMLATSLVFFMQAGFAMLEAGLTRSKNVVNIMFKNVIDFCVSSISYFIVGFGIMFGASYFGLFGTNGFMINHVDFSTADGLWKVAFFMFQCVFAGTTATIVSGAVSERIKLSAYMLFALVMGAIIYPVIGHWIWGGGWLSKLGMLDFAGSTVVHTVGGVAAFTGALILGPRLGKYTTKGKSTAIPGHSILLATLGVFILWFGWFGFNPGSTLEASLRAGVIALTTTLSASAGGLSATLFSWKKFGKPDLTMALNGVLAGLVAITAGCAFVSPVSALIIGSIAGILVVLAVEFIDTKLKVDDPVGAVSVHAVNGIFGTLAVGLFAQAPFSKVNGLLFGGGLDLFKIQLLGSVSTIITVFAVSYLFFKLIDKIVGLRISKEDEIRGSDLSEQGMDGYPEFQIFSNE